MVLERWSGTTRILNIRFRGMRKHLACVCGVRLIKNLDVRVLEVVEKPVKKSRRTDEMFLG